MRPNFLAELDTLDADVARLFSLPEDQLARPPKPGAWSALQCIEHLTLTAHLYSPLIEARLREARRRQATAPRRATPRPYTYTPLDRFIIWSIEPPPRVFKIAIPSGDFAPAPQMSLQQVRDDYAYEHAVLRYLIQELATIDMRATALRSPYRKLPAVNLGLAIGFLLGHERRHVYQAKKAAGLL